MNKSENIVMGPAFLQAGHVSLVHFHEALLGQNILVGLLIIVQWEYELKEPVSVEFQKPPQKLGCRNESDNVKHVHSPLK